LGKQKTKETIEIDNATVKIAKNYRYLGILYKNFIRSKMDYGATAYGSASKT
jgi:hypothetical protein